MATKTELTGAEIRYCTGASKAQFKVWSDGGLKLARTGADLYDARQFFLWYRDEVYRPSLGTAEGGVDLDVTSHKARYEKARAEKYQIRLQRLLSDLVPIDEAEFALFEMTEVFAEIAERIPKGLAPKIVEKDESEMLMATDNFVRSLLINYSKMGDDIENSEDKEKEEDES